MKFYKTEIEGVFIIEPIVFKDNRGEFFESFNLKEFEKNISKIDFVQDNQSTSSFGVIRGFHFQKPPYAQAKLVRCVEGSVLDIAIDIRKESSTYGKHVAVELSAENRRQLYIPRGFAHGFAVLSERAVFQYKCDNFYCKESEGGISVLSHDLGIKWPIDIKKAILSEKDLGFEDWNNFESPF